MASIPAFLTDALEAQYGPALTAEILQGYASRRPVTLRVNTLKATPAQVQEQLTQAGLRYESVAWSPEALILPDCQERDLEALPLYERGEVYLQSLSSMLPPLFVQPVAGENLLDMAAAPGGKTTQLAALSGGKAMITACEKNAIRAERLKFNLSRQGASRVSVLVQDARKLDDFFSFDKILLDAPCSGSGTLYVENGELKSKFSKELVDNSSRLQAELLRKALKLLRSEPRDGLLDLLHSPQRKRRRDLRRAPSRRHSVDSSRPLPRTPSSPRHAPRRPLRRPHPPLRRLLRSKNKEIEVRGTPGEAASLREAPPPDPLPKSSWRLNWVLLRRWFRLSVGARFLASSTSPRRLTEPPRTCERFLYYTKRLQRQSSRWSLFDAPCLSRSRRLCQPP